MSQAELFTDKIGLDHFYRLDMTKPSVRNKVRAVADNNALDQLFETDAVIEE